MSLYHFLLHALCQAIIWALISIESHETWKGRPGKRFYEAVKMEFVFQLQFTEHGAKRLPRSGPAYSSLPHFLPHHIPKLSCLRNLEESCLGHQETTFGFCLFKSKETKLEALFSTHVFQGVSSFKETQVHCSMEFMT